MTKFTMKPNYTVSVAMATYNGEDFLREQLDSIIAQTHPVDEIVISDDNSKDSTKNILIEYQSKYPGIIKLSLNDTNVGFIRNFERAIESCTSHFVALCDQDDVWDETKIERLVTEIGSHDLIHSDAQLVDKKCNSIAASFSRYSKKNVKHRSFTDICINNSVTGCTCMFKRTILEKALPFPAFLPHDHWLAIVAKDGNGIAYYPHPLISYRQHGKNAIGAKNATNRHSRRDIHSRTRRQILNDKKIRYQNLYEYAQIALSNDSSKKIKEIADYYSSYFVSRVRVKSFLFHLRHLGTFSNRKTILQTLHALLFALYDQG